MEPGEILITIKVLHKETGWHWPKLLISATILSGKIYKKSSWSRRKGEAAQLIKRLAFIPAIYIELSQKYGKEKGEEITEKVVMATSIKEMEKFLPKEKHLTPMKRLLKFREKMEKEGISRFNTVEDVKCTETICHFRIKECIIYQFFKEINFPHLTQMFCRVDNLFFQKAFPEFKFHRGNGENTIYHGKKYCEFIFELKEEKSGKIYNGNNNHRNGKRS
ncbi:L-2-amino-thiazoline-4-carboxylic acid hydrolase [Desulfurobacterium atlanticum]|uniref:L-2-amino-thiazoline-4-carboxylic acid hydrolase n=1 Tax=Desulfurobacterium atlanticum TaxID=240169 RepID=A0A238XMN5_9BACT|nr:L-2-amino-thiazoline-4-carboxylic acid hydrolase [Desulfurobacterium atlanticum]SNR60276.1 L-2-amino-thiazoline-4-carboxylic acid hydrolase [Desulfurobacterium atlanticum]